MELGLSLGSQDQNTSNKRKKKKKTTRMMINTTSAEGLDLISMSLGLCCSNHDDDKIIQKSDDDDRTSEEEEDGSEEENMVEEMENPLQLSLQVPLGPVPRRHLSSLPPWSSDNGSSENGSSGNTAARLGVNKVIATTAVEEASSTNSDVGSPAARFHMKLGSNIKRSFDDGAGNNEEEENGANNNNTRKKLRLSKQQSAYLEESFKEHNTLNPKQKLGLAKQLNLRPRQVEVWFQNRRARTKLKQTEVDCEYLKRCCETLTEENRRLHKELQELRGLKTSNPFYAHLPPTTLTMCPSCERVAPTSAAADTRSFYPFLPAAGS